MKRLILILPAALILFTTACASALIGPAALLLEASLHGDGSSTAAKVADNTSTPKANSVPTAPMPPAHVSGASSGSRHHISGKVSGEHISGGSYSHISGGGYY